MNILEHDSLYTKESDGVKLNEIVYDNEAANILWINIKGVIYKYGDVTIFDIFDITSALSLSDINLKQPSYLSHKYRFDDIRTLEFKLDHEPKNLNDVYWKLIIDEHRVIYS